MTVLAPPPDTGPGVATARRATPRAQPSLVDSFGRAITYLRISVTDRTIIASTWLCAAATSKR